MPRTRFIVFAQGRTGSTLLGHLLTCAPGLRCDGEMLAYEVRAPVTYMNGRSRMARVATYGFKVKIYQLTDRQHVDPRSFLRDMSYKGWKILYLHRDNPLRQVLSNMSGKRDGWHFRSPRPHSDQRLRVDVSALLSALEARARWTADERRALDGLEFLDVSYERDLSDPERHQATVDRICEFLGVPSGPVRARTAKRLPGTISDVATNPDEIRRALTGTDFEHYLED